MKIKKFNQLTEEELNYIIDIHFNHCVKFNPKMVKENTIYKFTNYNRDTYPNCLRIVRKCDCTLTSMR